MPEDTSKTIRGRVGAAARALLAPSQDGDPSPQARDERPIVIGRREHTDEPDREDIKEWRDTYRENPLIRVPIQNFASDVTEPGASVAVDTGSEDSDVPSVPTDYPDEAYRGQDLDVALELWLANCYVDGWDFDADISDLLEAFIKDRRGRRGTAIIEHAYDDPRKRERILALRPIKAETMTAYTREGKGIVLRPDDSPNEFDSVAIQDLSNTGRDTAPTTPAGKTAALAQFDDVYGADERDEIPFALDDVTVSPYDADTGELFGRPDSAPVVDRAQAVYNKLEHIDQAILNTAFANIIAKVETNDEEVAKKLRDDLDINNPETVSGTNVPTDIIELEGSVPDAVKQVQQEIEFVLSAMPTPLYRVGFAGDINRDVTSEQRADYREDVKRERRRLESDFETILRLKAKDFLYGDAHSDKQLDVTPKLRLRPEEASSPLRDEEFDPEAFSTLMTGLSEAAGARGGAEAILPPREIVGTLLDMDADEILGEETEADLTALDEADPRVRETFVDLYGAELAGLAETDPVTTPDGRGVIVDVHEDEFEFAGESYQPDGTLYVVATEEGADVYESDDLEAEDWTTDIGTGGPDDLEEAALAGDYAALADPFDADEAEALLDVGFDSWPDSWEDADVPARLIALDAWTSMEASFTGCMKEIGDAGVCAAFKDEILQTTGWR